jgi:hypothetical protein
MCFVAVWYVKTICGLEHRAVPECVNGLHRQLSPLLRYALASTSLRTRAVGCIGGPRSLYDGAIQRLRARQRDSQSPAGFEGLSRRP